MLILFPLLVPIPVLAIAWIFFARTESPYGSTWPSARCSMEGNGPLNIFSMTGLIVCQSLASTPFVFLLLTATLRSMNPQMEEASGASGASPLTTFRKVTLPVLLPGILAPPVILVTLITLEQFELPLIIACRRGSTCSLTASITNSIRRAAFPTTAAQPRFQFLFLALGMLALTFYNWTIRRADKFAIVTGKAYRQRQIPLGRWKIAAYALLTIYAALAVVLPAFVLIWI